MHVQDVCLQALPVVIYKYNLIGSKVFGYMSQKHLVRCFGEKQEGQRELSERLLLKSCCSEIAHLE